MRKILELTSEVFLLIFAVVGVGSNVWSEEFVADQTVSVEGASAPRSLEDEVKALRIELEETQKKVDKKQDKSDSSHKFASKIGGLVVFDSLSASQNAASRDFYGDVDNGLLMREARFVLKGEGYERLNYECGVAVQAQGGGLLFKNVTVGVKEVPVFQNVKVGHFKVETAMSELDAIIDVPSVYYNANTMAFSPHRRIGVASTTTSRDRRIRWFNGVFSCQAFDEEASVATDSPGLLLNTRLTGAPVYIEDEEGALQEVVHLGGSFYWCDPSDDLGTTTRLRVRPTGWGVDMPYLLSGSVPLGAGTYNVSEAEAAWQRGGFGVQSETFLGSFDRLGFAWGSSLTTRLFLGQGNYRTYSKDKGGFTSARLASDSDSDDESRRFFPKRWGAWELLASYTYADMKNLKNAPNSIYGSLNETSLGVNWWWTPQLRWTCHWVRDYSDAVRSSTGAKAKGVVDTIALQANASF